jgi:hypothetical protein
MEMICRIRAPTALTEGMYLRTYRIGGWVGYIADLDAFEGQKIICPCQDWNTGLSSCRHTDHADPLLRRGTAWFYSAVCVPLLWH